MLTEDKRMSENERVKTEKTDSFSCPSCGGRMLFDPETQMLKCPYCESTNAIKTIREKPNEYDINLAPSEDESAWGDVTRVARCQGCGAEIVLTGETTAETCAFCGAPHVAVDQSKAGIAPESVIPFAVTQKQAVSAFRQWIKRKLFAPSKAKKMAALGKIAGVYLPHWTYDADSVSDYIGQEGHHYYVDVPVTVTKDGKTHTEMRREQRTDWRPTRGRVSHSFDDVLVAGSTRLPENLLSRVRPFDLKRLVRYEPEFISGFASEKPAVDVKAGWHEAEQIIEGEMHNLAMQDILSHADEARVTSLNTENSQVKYKLTLLPMYLSAFQFKNKSYHVLVNGQNCRVGGQAPVSALRVLIAVALVIALIVLLYYLFASGDDSGEVYYYVGRVLSHIC